MECPHTFDIWTYGVVVLKLSFLSVSPPQGQADLLKHAKSEALDTLRQIHCAAQSCGLSKNGAASPQLQPHHPHHQPQQTQLQPPAKPNTPHPALLYQTQTQLQPQAAPQAYLHPHVQQYPQSNPQLPALPLLQTVTKPPAYPQPPTLPQFQFQSQQPQRAAGPLDTISEKEKEMVSECPAGSCWPAACAHRESYPKGDREVQTEKQKSVGEKQEASKERVMEEVAERVKEMMMVRKTRVRSETRVWWQIGVGWRAEGDA